jgi:hypothetical protein
LVALRATRKVLKYLSRSDEDSGDSSTALGDWYVNRLVVDRKPLLLLICENSRLAIIEPAQNVKELPNRLPDLVARRLDELGISDRHIKSEVSAMMPVIVGPTKNRSIVGQMVDFAKAIPLHIPEYEWNESDLRDVEVRLGETPCLCSGKLNSTIWPAKETRELLAQKWK